MHKDTLVSNRQTLFYCHEEVSIDDFNTFTFKSFLNYEVVFYVESNLSKRELRHFRISLQQKSFYPIHIIRINDSDDPSTKNYKLIQSQQNNEKLFLKRYNQIAQKQFNGKSLFEIIDKITQCPFWITSRFFCKFLIDIFIVFQIFPRYIFSIQPLGIGVNRQWHQ